jgi:hypothetical protein
MKQNKLMETIDYRKMLREFYQPGSKEVVAVDVPAMNFLMIDGVGDPNTSESFSEAIEALFAVAYTLKFVVKKGPQAIDYGVMPLEALWWADDMTTFSPLHKEVWKWRAMLMQPDLVTADMVSNAVTEVKRKKNPAAIDRLQFEGCHEGLSAQIMHIGPFSEEGPTIEKVHRFIEAAGRERRGYHHEIYLSDIRRADPSKWKTIVRQPMT